MDRPLAGLRVLDYCWVGAGAFVTKMLADHGAEVIKVESRARPDNLRVSPPFKKGVDPKGPDGLDRSGYFASRNTNKKSFALNMRHPEALPIARQLAARSSIVTSNFRPGIMERWGLGYDDIRALNPSIIYLAMPMQGSDGPHRQYVGFGSTIAALAGLVALSGLPDRAPVGSGTHYPDHIPNPGHALVALLAAMYRREVRGEGAAIELSQFESMINVLGPAVMAVSAGGGPLRRDGNRSPAMSPNGVFPCAGVDRWCAISATCDQEWDALADELGHPEWSADPRFATFAGRKANEPALEALIAEATCDRDPWLLASALQARGVAAAVVQTSADLLHDPHLAARGYWRRLEHPVMGSIAANNVPFRSSVDQFGPSRAAPLLGQHTREIAEGLLGLEPAEVSRLMDEKVLY